MVRRTLADICRLIAWEKLESWEDTKPTDTEELESIENIQVVEVNQVDSTITESICSNIIQDILERKESDTSISREIKNTALPSTSTRSGPSSQNRPELPPLRLKTERLLSSMSLTADSSRFSERENSQICQSSLELNCSRRLLRRELRLPAVLVNLSLEWYNTIL